MSGLICVLVWSVRGRCRLSVARVRVVCVRVCDGVAWARPEVPGGVAQACWQMGCGAWGTGPACQGYVWLVLLCFALRLCFPVLLFVVVCCYVVLWGYIVLCVLCLAVLLWLASLLVKDGVPNFR